MKAALSAAALALASPTLADESRPATHRYLIERTFPQGALDGVDAAAKKQVNDNNSKLDVIWEKSYASADQTKTWCVYTGPSEQAVRDAAQLNGLPVDSVVEIPADIAPEPKGQVHTLAAGNQRFLVVRDAPVASFAGAALKKLQDAEAVHGVKLLTSYAAADAMRSFWIYEAPSRAALEQAARQGGSPATTISEAPETLLPY